MSPVRRARSVPAVICLMPNSMGGMLQVNVVLCDACHPHGSTALQACLSTHLDTGTRNSPPCCPAIAHHCHGECVPRDAIHKTAFTVYFQCTGKGYHACLSDSQWLHHVCLKLDRGCGDRHIGAELSRSTSLITRAGRNAVVESWNWPPECDGVVDTLRRSSFNNLLSWTRVLG
ncbi:hypothetical protein K504DRAFT_224636 [Pleomassaria siparia CBS 279.74]|uniref:Uncharacterized protein n=1 Tax=Pleomassaria siparia CBS 279.74 TaxID=1314801 RepID=A0A6G1KG31_9PLEO|nr:hypothetical protein K504DRAFT_224636 [Pleomassaria siparia CBS 279.74]